MYPETDIPIQEISNTRWEEVCANLPMTSDERMERLGTLDISSNQSEAILNAEIDDILFDGIEGQLALPAKAWASALLEFGTSNVRALSVAIHLREEGVITMTDPWPFPVSDKVTTTIIKVLEEGGGDWPDVIITILGEIGDKKAIEPITKFLEKEHDWEEVQDAGKEALEKLK